MSATISPGPPQNCFPPLRQCESIVVKFDGDNENFVVAFADIAEAHRRNLQIGGAVQCLRLGFDGLQSARIVDINMTVNKETAQQVALFLWLTVMGVCRLANEQYGHQILRAFQPAVESINFTLQFVQYLMANIILAFDRTRTTGRYALLVAIAVTTTLAAILLHQCIINPFAADSGFPSSNGTNIQQLNDRMEKAITDADAALKEARKAVNADVQTNHLHAVGKYLKIGNDSVQDKANMLEEYRRQKQRDVDKHSDEHRVWLVAFATFVLLWQVVCSRILSDPFVQLCSGLFFWTSLAVFALCWWYAYAVVVSEHANIYTLGMQSLNATNDRISVILKDALELADASNPSEIASVTLPQAYTDPDGNDLQRFVIVVSLCLIAAVLAFLWYTRQLWKAFGAMLINMMKKIFAWLSSVFSVQFETNLITIVLTILAGYLILWIAVNFIPSWLS